MHGIIWYCRVFHGIASHYNAIPYRYGIAVYCRDYRAGATSGSRQRPAQLLRKGGFLRELVWLGKDGGTRDAQGTLKKTGKTQNVLCICYFLSLNLNRCLRNPPSLVLPSPHQRTFNQHPTFSHLCICSSYTLLGLYCSIWEAQFKEYVFSRVGKTLPTTPIIGALGHRTDCIVKQPKNATITTYLYSYSPALCCHKRNSGLSCRSYMYKQSSTHALENLNFV